MKNIVFFYVFLRRQLGVVLLEQGKASQALAYLDKALEIDPEHGQALLNSAILLQELGRPELRQIARDRLLKLLSMDGKIRKDTLKVTMNLISIFDRIDVLNETQSAAQV